jgi:hypothetical protein
MENELLKIDFLEHYDRLVRWFRVKMNTEQTQITYDKCKGYPLDALKFAVDYFIDHGRPTPGNFPTTADMTGKFWEWLDSHPDEKFRRMYFDSVEDYTYPVAKLWEGYKVLMESGDVIFNRFADANRMPKNDRARVKMKAQIVSQGREGDFNVQLSNLTGSAGRTA